VAENNWFAPERQIEFVDISLAVGFPVCLAGYPPAAPEAKLGESRLLLIVGFEAPVDMLPPLFHDDTNAFC
jgi:hypothetical protein